MIIQFHAREPFDLPLRPNLELLEEWESEVGELEMILLVNNDGKVRN